MPGRTYPYAAAEDYLRLTELRHAFRSSRISSQTASASRHGRPVYQADIKAEMICEPLVLHGSPSIIRVGLSHGIVTYLHDAFIYFAAIGWSASPKLPAPLYGATDGQLQLYGNTRVVLRREESYRWTAQNKLKMKNTTRRRHRHTVRTAQFSIRGVPQLSKPSSVRSIGRRISDTPGLLTLQTQQLRTEHRRKRQGRNGGDEHNGASSSPTV